MKFKFFVLFALVVTLVSTVQSQKNDDCEELGKRVSDNLKQMENSAGKSKLILQQDCNFAKNSVTLTRKYSKCMPQNTEGAVSRVYRNMRQVAKIICENVNQRVAPCFSQENMRQFNQCTNRTLQYMTYVQKQSRKSKKGSSEDLLAEEPATNLDSDSSSALASDEDTLNKEVVPTPSGRTVSRRKKPSKNDQETSSVAKKRPANNQDNARAPDDEEDLGLIPSTRNNRRAARSRRSSSSNEELTEYEHSCCMMHLNSDCFLTKVIHHCADSSQLRTVRLLQTMLNFVVRDFVDVVCGRIESLEQCKQYSASMDEDELGF